MNQWGSSGALVGGALLVVFFALVLTSSWLNGRHWFIATVVVLAASLVSLEWGTLQAASTIEMWLARGGMALFFLVFVYFIGGRYLTQTKFMNMTYQSHEDLVRFIDESGNSSLFARIMRKMGPVLFIFLLLLGAVVVWADLAGALA